MRGAKTVQNWESATRTAKTDEAKKVVPASALTDLLLARWRGKQPKIRVDPPELQRALNLVRELHARTRGDGIAWANLLYQLQRDLEAFPRVGERYRPIAGAGGDPPSG